MMAWRVSSSVTESYPSESRGKIRICSTEQLLAAQLTAASAYWSSKEHFASDAFPSDARLISVKSAWVSVARTAVEGQVPGTSETRWSWRGDS